MLCHLSFLTIVEDESTEEEEEMITEDMAKEALWDSLSPFGVVRQLLFVKRTKKSLSIEVTMDKPSESLRSAMGMNGVSLPLTRLTSSLVRTQFLGVKTTKLMVTFPSVVVPENAQVMLKRRFACCGQLLHVAALQQQEHHAVQITFDSNLSALRAMEDFNERGVLGLLPTDVKLSFQEEEEALPPPPQQQQPKRVQQTAATKRARTPMVEVTKRKPSVNDGDLEEDEGLKRTKSEPTVLREDEEEDDEVVSRHQLFIVHSKQISPEELEEVFKAQLGCVQIEIMRTKKKHDLVRGTSFVTFDTAEAAQAAQRQWDGMEFPAGCFLKAMFARGQRTSPLSVEKPQHRNEELEPTPTKIVNMEPNNSSKHRGSAPSNADALIDSFGNAMALNSSPMPQTPPAHWTNTASPAMQQQQWVSPSEFQYQQQPMYAYDYAMPQQYFMPPPPDAMYTPPLHWPYGPPPTALPPLPPQQRLMYFIPGMNEQADNSRLYVSYVRPTPGSPSQGATASAAVADPITEDHIKQFFSAAAGDLHHVYKVKDRPVFFVKFRTTFSAMQAMLRLNGFNLNGCTLRVVLADPPRMDSRNSHNHTGNKSPGSGANAPESESKRRRDENGGE